MNWQLGLLVAVCFLCFGGVVVSYAFRISKATIPLLIAFSILTGIICSLAS